MDMRFYWLKDREAQNQFKIYWRAGKLNRGDYYTKHHPAIHHINTRKQILTRWKVVEALRTKLCNLGRTVTSSAARVRRITVNLVTAAIKDVYYAELNNPVEGLNSVEIQDIIHHIEDRYCHIDQADLDKNLECFNRGIDPSVPLIVYIWKQEDCQEFANDGNINTPKATMVTTSTKHAIQCGAFSDAWKEWNCIPRANQTWLAWKTHWTHAFKEQKTIQ
eukprot:CCRYP_011921-RA/>CCRYP_011921-RA protein AED:0.46 eAED:0.46 QI:0/0/0/1/0/0/2/0/219